MNELKLETKFARYTRLYESGLAYLPIAGLACRGEGGELTGAAITRFALYEGLLQMEPAEAALKLHRATLLDNKVLTCAECEERAAHEGGAPNCSVCRPPEKGE